MWSPLRRLQYGWLTCLLIEGQNQSRRLTVLLQTRYVDRQDDLDTHDGDALTLRHFACYEGSRTGRPCALTLMDVDTC